MAQQLIFPAYGSPTFFTNPNDRIRGNGWFSNYPPAAREVTARATAIGQLKVTWKDYRTTDHWDINEDFAWQIRYTPVTLQGVPEIDLVFQKSRILGSQAAFGDGGTRTFSYAEVGISDGWIQVVGRSQFATGKVSSPIFVQLAGNTNLIPDVGIVIGGWNGVYYNSTPYESLYWDFNYYINSAPIEFAGVHIHVIGYNAGTEAEEIGAMDRWPGSTGFVYIPHRLPVDSGQITGVATFTNLSKNVVRVSGGSFTAGMVGNYIIPKYDGALAGLISARADGDHITLFSNFTGITGNYSFVVLHDMTFYFVPIGVSGARVGDITTASAVTI